MGHMLSKTWRLGTLAVAITGIVVSNFVGGSGSASGEGSSIPSKVTFMIGALSGLLFLVLTVASRVRRYRNRNDRPARAIT